MLHILKNQDTHISSYMAAKIISKRANSKDVSTQSELINDGISETENNSIHFYL